MFAGRFFPRLASMAQVPELITHVAFSFLDFLSMMSKYGIMNHNIYRYIYMPTISFGLLYILHVCFSSEFVITGEGGKKTVIFHSTLYDAAWEKAAIEAQTPIYSITVDVACQKLATKVVRNMLLEEWKKGEAKGPEFSAKFVADVPSLPEITQVPELALCKIMEPDTLTIPSDIRQRFLRDPLRSKEWKVMLAEFDKKFEAATEGQSAVAPAPNASETNEAAAGNGAAQDPWAQIFADSPKELEKLEAMTVSATFPLGSGSMVCKVVEGPQFYICATTAAGSIGVQEALFLHGGGQWLLDSKAAKALQDITCVF